MQDLKCFTSCMRATNMKILGEAAKNVNHFNKQNKKKIKFCL